MILPRSFYDRPTLLVARQLLGMRLVRILEGQRLSGIILETEAYVGPEDKGSHAHRGKTARNAPMFGPPGYAYVYFTYGMHWCLNVVTEAEGFPAAVLIRAILPEEGGEVMRTRRNGGDTLGPAKLTQALGIGRSENGIDLCTTEQGLWIEYGAPIPEERVTTTPRIGLNRVPEPWKSIPWRFVATVENHLYS
ncbi:MAG: DNA-3-methyladenine glycosylase [Anaerolineales bacterium]